MKYLIGQKIEYRRYEAIPNKRAKHSYLLVGTITDIVPIDGRFKDTTPINERFIYIIDQQIQVLESCIKMAVK